MIVPLSRCLRDLSLQAKLVRDLLFALQAQKPCMGNDWRKWADRHVKTSNRSFCEKTMNIMNQPRKTMEAMEGGQ